MVGQTTLSVAIDAKEAKKGAADFVRAADDIKRKAAKVLRAVGRGNQAFRNMRAAANDSLRALAASVAN